MCIYTIRRTSPHTVTLYWRGVPITANIPNKFTANITERLLKELIDGYNRDEERLQMLREYSRNAEARADIEEEYLHP